MLQPERRVVAYEALRGGAALAVVLNHCFLAFGYPTLHGVLPMRAVTTLSNAKYAVILFFVLSGFVLSRGHFAKFSGAKLAASALKRWPRLALLTTLSTLTSWALRSAGLFWYVPAAALPGVRNKEWLASFAFGHAGQPPYLPDLWDSLWQGAVLTFLASANVSYNSSMWTMHPELLGSYLVFLFVLLLSRRQIAGYVAAALCLALSPLLSVYLVSFAAGVLLAFGLERCRPTLPAPLAVALLLAALCVPALPSLSPIVGVPDSLAATLIHTLGAVAIIAAVACCPPLEARLSGRVFAFLGAISFPLYLFHILVLMSLGCFVFVALRGAYAGIAATAATLAASIAISAWLGKLDRGWVAALNAACARALR